MDSLPSFLFILLSTLLISIYLWVSKKQTIHRTVPQVGGVWPITGHMHLLGPHQLTHKTLGAMADEYGPLCTIKLGSFKVLVVNSWEMARECFTVNDRAFSTRPTTAAFKLLGYNFAMFGFAPYGSYWREMRKIATVELLSNHRTEMLKPIRDLEVGNAIRDLYKNWVGRGSEVGGILIDMKQWFGELSLNVALRMVGGKRYCGESADCDAGEARKAQKIMKDYADLFGVLVLSDAIPFLGWLDFNGNEKAMRRTAEELDILVDGWLEEHKMNRLQGGKKKEEQDFMDVMLDILEHANISDFDADTINKATCMNLILAGRGTTMVTLTWALSLLLNHPQKLKLVQDELEIHVGERRHVDESDVKSLVYLQAVVKETLRLYPPSPVIMRAAMEDCTVSGYHIPSGTRLMLNIWKIQHDARVWPNPEEFQPERFLTSHKEMDLRGQNFELIPFGSGRRACPGISLGLRMIHFTLASLLHSFTVVNPSREDVDMSETNGLSNLKATPLDVLLIPRLCPGLYGLQTNLAV